MGESAGERRWQRVLDSQCLGDATPADNLLLPVPLCSRGKALRVQVTETHQVAVELTAKFFSDELLHGEAMRLHPKPKRGCEVLDPLPINALGLEVLAAMLKEVAIGHRRGERSVLRCSRRGRRFFWGLCLRVEHIRSVQMSDNGGVIPSKTATG